MQKLKRPIAVLLAALMLLSCAPHAAAADETTTQPQTTAPLSSGESTAMLTIAPVYTDGTRADAAGLTFRIRTGAAAADADYAGSYVILDADGAKRQEGTVTGGSVTFSPEETGWQLQLTDNLSGKYVSVTETDSGGLSLLDPAAQSAGPLTADTTLTFRYRAAAEGIVLSKIWNDNSNENGKGSRPGAASFGLALTFSLDGGATYTVLTEGNRPQLGLAAMPVPAADTSSSFNTWTYTYTGLPKYVSVNGTPVEVKYGAVETSVPDGYLASDNTGSSQAVTNTAAADFTATKVWQDNSNKYGTRPDDSVWLSDHLSVYRFVSGGLPNPASDVKIDSGSLTVTKNGDSWSVSLSGQPAYTAEGLPYVYYIAEKTANMSKNTATGTYQAEYENVGNFSSSTDYLYAGGTLTNTLTSENGFSVYKVWKDGGSSNRPTAMLYLYRFAEGVGDFDTASPVQGFDNKVVATADADGNHNANPILITFAGSEDLPKYDAIGRRYIYFAKEKLTGGDTTDYAQEIDNGAAADQTGHPSDAYVLNGGTITNAKKGETEIKAQKTFAAVAMQGMTDASVTFRLQRRQGTDVWQDVQVGGAAVETTVTGFSAENLTKAVSMGSFPKYDQNGARYDYRYIETSVTVNGSTQPVTPYDTEEPANGVLGQITLPDPVAPGGTTARFDILRNEDGSITDRLVGETQVKVEKTWSTTVDGVTSNTPPAGASVTVRLTRGSLHSIAAGAAADANTILDSAGEPVRDLVLSGTTWSGIFSALPRYDQEGREFEYSAEELSVSGADGYATELRFSKSTEAVGGSLIPSLETVITNTKGPGSTLIFDVEKTWLDDGDLMHRNPVTVALYNADGTAVSGTERTLNDQNLWKTRISIPKETGKTVSDYFIREITIEESPADNVTYTDPTAYVAFADIEAGTATAAGTAATTEHLYNVYLSREDRADGGYASFTVTNQRVGVLTLNLSKTWKAGGQTPDSTFRVLRSVGGGAAEQVGENFTLSAAAGAVTASWTSDGFLGAKLPKYDSLGRLYSYSLEETAIGGQPVTGGAATVDGERYVSAVNAGNTTYGSQHTNDVASWAAVNTRSQSTELTVRKIWRDDGSDGTRARPDVVFSVYRTTEKSAEQLKALSGGDLTAFLLSAEKVTADRLWNTKHNDWYWSCDLGSLPRYDANGRAYVYFLLESMNGNAGGIYHTEYYNGSVLPTDGKNGTAEAVTNTQETFAATDSMSDTVLILSDGTAGGSYSATTVNYRAADRVLYGEKIWTNLPNSFQRKNLPTIRINLYRSLSSDSAVLFGGTALDTVELDCSQTSRFQFGTAKQPLPRYDEYGRLYYYGAREATSVNGYVAQTTPIANDFILKNVYNLTPSTNRVTITLQKNWTVDSGPFAKTTFQLWRKLQTAGGTEIAGSDEQAASQEAVQPAAGTSTSVTFTTDSSGNNLPYYAPNGLPYLYYVKEVVPGGYEAALDGAKQQGTGNSETLASGVLTLRDGDGDGVFTNETAPLYQNTYNGNPLVAVGAAKVWDDQSNAYGTRPSGIVLTLWRKTAQIAPEQVAVSTADEAGWTKTGNRWTYSFGDRVKFASTGETYTYYIIESSAGGTELDSYYSSAGGLNARNTLETTQITVKKNWQKSVNGTESAMSDAEIDRLYALGAFPASLTFTVQYSDDGTTWNTLQKNGAALTCTAALNSAAAVRSLRDTGYVFASLPKYAAGSNSAGASQTLRLYRVVETGNGNFTPTYPAGINSGSYVIANTLAVREARIDKTWADENDRDNTRPASLSVTLTRDAQKSATLTLSKSGSTEINVWTTGLIYVPLYQNDSSTDYSVYAAAEPSVPAGYVETAAAPAHTTTDPLAAETENYNWFAFTNTLSSARAVTTLSAEKRWAGDASWSSLTRPAQVWLTLQVRGWDGTAQKYLDTWSTATPQNSGLAGSATVELTTTAATGTKASWAGVWKYQAQTTGTPTPVQYRVIETNAAGTAYTPTAYQSASAPASTDGVTAAATVVTNTLKTVPVRASKQWGFVGTTETLTAAQLSLLQSAGVLPVQLRFYAAYTTDSTGQSGWTELPSIFYTADLSTVTNLNKWIGGASYSMPEYDKNGTKLYYKLTERTAQYGSKTAAWTDLADTTLAMTNTWSTAGYAGGNTATVNRIPVGSVTASKVWLDELNRDNLRGAVTLQLVRDGAAYGPAVTIQKDSSGSWPSYTWQNLPLYQNGTNTQSTYTVTETAVNGYTGAVSAAVSADPANGTTAAAASSVTVTNSRTPQRFTVTAQKVWSDQNDAYGSRAESVELTLQYRDGTEWKNVTAGTLSGGRYADDGIYTTSAVTQTVSAGETAAWNDVPVNRGGTAVSYRVAETAVSGYTPAYAVSGAAGTGAGFTGAANGTAAVTVTNTLNTTSMTVQKTWTGDGYETAQVRPASVSAAIEYSHGGGWTVLKTVTLNSANKWSASLTGLPVTDAAGNAYAYRVSENDGGSFDEHNNWTGTTGSYQAAGSVTANAGGTWSANLTNTLDAVSITGQKIWDDNGDRDGLRPDSVTLQLYRDGAPFGTPVTVGAAGNWSFTWNGLPKKQNDGAGNSVYTVQETVLPAGYAKAEAGAEVTNDHASGTFTITAEKRWVDNQNEYDLRTASVTLELQAAVSADGTTYGSYAAVSRDPAKTYLENETGTGAYTTSLVRQTITGAETADTWTGASWADLPVSSGGYPIRYRVVEVAVPASYTATCGSSEAQPITGAAGSAVSTFVENKLTGAVSLTVQKNWDAESWNAMPDSVTVQLQSSADDGASWTDVENGQKVLTAADNWSDSFGRLPDSLKYRAVETGITYGTVTLPASGTAVGNFTISSATEYDAAAKTYTTTIGNTIPAIQALTVQKSWDDGGDRDRLRPDAVQAQLYRDGIACGAAVTLNEANDWSVSFQNLPVYQNGSATERSVYTVQEVSVPDGYAETDSAPVSVSAETAQQLTVTNTHTPDSFTISARKLWTDNDNAGQTRPDSVELTLEYLDPADQTWKTVGTAETVSGTTPTTQSRNPQTISAPYTDEAVWTVPCRTAGTAVSYRVAEAGVASYTQAIPETGSTVNGETKSVTVENTLQSATLSAEKRWDDQNDRFGTRPEGVEISLQRSTDGSSWEDVAGRTAVLNESNQWSADFDTLPVYADAANTVSYSYRAVETALDYADATTAAETENGLKTAGTYAVAESTVQEGRRFATQIVNTLQTTGLTAAKQWEDQYNFFGTRPAQSLTVKAQRRLKLEGVLGSLQDQLGDGSWQDVAADGAPLTAELTYDPASMTWTAADFGALPAADASGKRYEYRAVETTAVPGYTSASAGTGETTITNTLKTTSVTLTKTWDDQENRYGTRPDALALRLTEASGWAVPQPTFEVAAETASDWVYTALELPEYVPGTDTKAQYSIEETVPDGYDGTTPTSAANGAALLTNRLKTVAVNGTKRWADEDNRYLSRPESLTLTVSDQNGALKVQPEFRWEKNGAVWSYSAAGLPEYVPGTGTRAVYQISETVPALYRADSTAQPGKDGSFTNSLVMPRCSATITKHSVDLDGTKLAGCTYLLRRTSEGGADEYYAGLQNGTAVFTGDRSKALRITTGADGTATVNGLPYGDYAFLEVEAPAGHAIDETPIPFLLNAESKTTAVQVAQADPLLPETTTAAETTAAAEAAAGVRTGDRNPILLWALTLAASGCAAAALLLSRRKKKQ